MLEVALGEVTLQADTGFDKLEAELTDVNTGKADQLYRVRREIPEFSTMYCTVHNKVRNLACYWLPWFNAVPA